MSKVSYERQKAVAQAWKNEKALVLEGKGTRNWSQKEQREIIATGKAKGYQGHHMKSVDGHNSKAGDPNNIQFLTRSEHLEAHKGNYRNNTNGYYNPETGKMNDFGRYKANVEPKKLSEPLNDSQKKNANKKADAIRTEKNAKARERMADRQKAKSTPSKNQASTKSKTLEGQKSAKPTAASNTATQSKTLSGQRATAASKSAGTGKGASHGPSSGGKGTSSGKGASSGQGASSGKGASHGR